MTQNYPKRLIEVDLPIKRISAHARREKSTRHGHISTLHIWWARRPLAACRAVLCASLWPDPADPICPQSFRDKASEIISNFAQAAVNKKELSESCDHETWAKWQALAKTGGLDSRKEVHWNILRFALLDFIADFANWDNSTVKEYLDASRALTRAAHEALGGGSGTRPLIADPFAGGGSIPLEALRVGADAFASDLNPIAVLLNTVVETLEVGENTINDYLEVAERISHRLGAQLDRGSFVEFWSRTIMCEGPACGVEIPLIRDGQISKRGRYGLEFILDGHGRAKTEKCPTQPKVQRPMLRVVRGGTGSRAHSCKNGSVTCPVCDFTHKQAHVARQALSRGFGERLIALGEVVNNSKAYRAPSIQEELYAIAEVPPQENRVFSCLSVPINPDRPSPAARGMSAVTRYGYLQFCDLFSKRQLQLLESVRLAIDEELTRFGTQRAPALRILLAITLNRLAAFQNKFCRWAPKGEHPVPPFGKNGFPMIWDYVEASPFGNSAGSWEGAVDWIRRVLEHLAASRINIGTVVQSDSQVQVLPNDSVDVWMTDPPYYDSYPYADLSDFFYPILRASLETSDSPVASLFSTPMTPKEEELVLQPTRKTAVGPKDHQAYRTGMARAFRQGRSVTSSEGIAVIVFANKTTGGWEALLGSVCDAGWSVTASWPIDTERESRSTGQARLQSSVHLVCRPRKGSDERGLVEAAGDWRDVLQELPLRIKEWMPRLANEGVVGADAIFACLGPALEVFSRYSRVEKANGEAVTLREYLEHVWAAVAKEALTQVFKGADATGFEPDARLTAMWLWTLNAPASKDNADASEEEDEDEEQEAKKPKTSGFKLEYDAARKIAQGLGAAFENLTHLVEVKGDEARLLPVAERTRHLFGKEEEEPARTARKKASIQMDMFAELTTSGDAEIAWQEKTVKRVGETTLDRVHQAMILFAAGRGEALKRFVVEEGVGQDGKFWRLAQALSALYPTATDEKRWVDGLLARKKQFGF
jgi:adenine-specific DNA methylase